MDSHSRLPVLKSQEARQLVEPRLAALRGRATRTVSEEHPGSFRAASDSTNRESSRPEDPHQVPSRLGPTIAFVLLVMVAPFAPERR